MSDLLLMTWTFLWLSLLCVGGGLGVIPEMQRQVVANHQWVTAREFVDGYTLAQLTPGPTMLVVAFVGYRAHGLPGAEQAMGAIAHERHDEHGRARGELRERVAVHELARGHPLVVGHDLALHLWNDAEAAAHTEQAQPEERPRHQQQVAHGWPSGAMARAPDGSARGRVRP